MRLRGFAWGTAAGLFLLGVYAGTLALANSLEHVLQEFLRLWAWMVPLIAGFSIQVGLFAYARGVASALDAKTHAHGVVASGGASALSMVACCAHHLADLLPVVGFAGAVTLLAAYQNVLLLAGVLSNVVGLIYVLGMLRRHGLFPNRKSLLSSAVRWPIHRALTPAIAVSAVVLVIALIRAIT
jgi:hypothetical protein